MITPRKVRIGPVSFMDVEGLAGLGVIFFILGLILVSISGTAARGLIGLGLLLLVIWLVLRIYLAIRSKAPAG